MKIYTIILCGLFLFFSCDHNKKELQKEVKKWIDKEIVFPAMKAKMMGRDTLWSAWSTSKFKILHFIDTTGCTACRLQLYDWGKYIDNLKNNLPEIAVIFVVDLKNYVEFERMAKINHFKQPILLDHNGEMDSLNHFSSNPLLQTFLLNDKNQVLAIGNPVKNEMIDQLFRKIIKDK